MLPVVFEEFELDCIFCCFSSHYHHQLVKGQLQEKSGGTAASPPAPRFLRVCIT